MRGLVSSRRRPNALPISRRERGIRRRQNGHDLAREAVGCNGVFGGAGLPSSPIG
jgi:hypothetical protein